MSKFTKCRLDSDNTGKGLYFQLVLVDGNEDTEDYYSHYVGDSSDQISLAESLGFPGYDPTKDKHGEGLHGQAHDWLTEHAGQTFDIPEGYFAPLDMNFGRYVQKVVHHMALVHGKPNFYPAFGERLDKNGERLTLILDCYERGVRTAETAYRLDKKIK